MTGGSYYHPVLYSGNADAFFDGLWFRCLPPVQATEPLVESTARRNRGVLRRSDVLGVPWTLRRYPKTIANDPDAPQGEFRWIDNWGTLHSQFVRYGGEWGGLVPVYNHGSGSVCLEGSFAEYKSMACRLHAPVVHDSTAGFARLFGMSLIGANDLSQRDVLLRHADGTAERATDLSRKEIVWPY